MEAEVKIRIGKAWTVLKKLTASRNIFFATVQSVLLYGSPVWNLTKDWKIC